VPISTRVWEMLIEELVHHDPRAAAQRIIEDIQKGLK
jgi:hypothetical protein